MAPKTPAEALAFLGGLSPSSIRLGLDRVLAALEALGHPERRLRILHVAGTNGKGSTCAFVDAVLRAEGHKVGLYTSPHLESVNERIRVGFEPISDRSFGQRILEVLEAFPQALAEPPELTYFELGTVVALHHFAKEGVDAVVLETGLGGRLDATSAATPRVTAITSISFDHMEYLGHTLGAIAQEKAGILKPGVPLVLARQPPEAHQAIAAVAHAVGAPLFVEGEHFELRHDRDALRYRGLQGEQRGLRLGLLGEHQLQNAAVALASLEVLDQRGVPSSPKSRAQGLFEARWPGRLEQVAQDPMVILDGAHNEAGAAALRAALDSVFVGRKVHLVFGVLADKAYGPMVSALFPRCASVHLTPAPSPRTLAPDALVPRARELCSEVTAHPDARTALEAAIDRAGEGDVVLGCGSLFLVGALRTLARERNAHRT